METASQEEVGATTPTPLPWRKRHPVLSRVLLFGIAGVLGWVLLSNSLQRDSEDRRTKLEGQLTAMELPLAMKGGAELVLKQVRDDFIDADDVPEDLRARALRFGALATKRLRAAGKAEDEDVRAAFGRALAATDDKEARRGIVLEACEAHLEGQDVEAARAILDASLFSDAGPVWALWHEVFDAKVTAQTDTAAAAKQLDLALDQAVAAGEAGLRAAPAYVGARTWTLGEVATHATEKRVTLAKQAGTVDLRPLWVRLAGLVSGDVPSSVVCARGLLTAGDTRGARRLLQAARSADPKGLESSLRGQPDLQSVLDLDG